MEVVFISNYYNHHQESFSIKMYELLKGHYYFIETQPMEVERIELGWHINKSPEFLKHFYKNEEKQICINLINNADVVIFGSGFEQLIKDRLIKNKLVFRYSERWYKDGYKFWKFPMRIIKHYFLFGRYPNTYMFCSSAYTAADCAKTGLYKNKTYKWGYFPKTEKYKDINRVMNSKGGNSILWVARFIDWKHPEVPLEVAKKLREDGYKFNLKIIGSGVLNDRISEKINNYGLHDYVECLGAMKPESVRLYMEKSEIFMFTSDFNEGWGAVLNEAMNSACACVASHAIGAVPYLIKDKENGLIYKNGSVEDCYNKVKYLIDNPEARKQIGNKAYETIANDWNAEVAATRFIELSKQVLEGNKYPNIYKTGPCSKAEIIHNGWYK